MSRMIKIRITKAKRASFVLNKFIKSKCFSKKTKTRVYDDNKTHAQIRMRSLDEH